MRATCVFTVWSLTTSSFAISAFVSPRATSRRTSSSRAVRPSSAARWSRRLARLSEAFDEPAGDRRARTARPPSAATRIAASSCSLGRVLQQEAARPGAQRREDVFVEVERREDEHTRSDRAARRSCSRRRDAVKVRACGCPSARHPASAPARARAPPRRRSPRRRPRCPRIVVGGSGGSQSGQGAGRPRRGR